MDHKTDPPSSASRGEGKRPAGRTKFQETRHPVFRGVRRWVFRDVQRAATEAVAEFMRRHGGGSSNSSAAPPQSAAASPASILSHHHHHETAPVHNGMHELDMYGGMDAGSYYASLAEGLLMEPPPTAVECTEDDECAGMELWS